MKIDTLSDMQQYEEQFLDYIDAKDAPNDREQEFFKKAQKYVRRIAWIPGIRMVAICNSLSFYATHEHSDIDLFIITAPRRMWFVRVLSTMILQLSGVRRSNLLKNPNKDVTGKICLSFFCTTRVLDFSKISYEDDVYLYFWMVYLKPVIDRGRTYEKFLAANTIHVSADQMEENLQFLVEGRTYTLREKNSFFSKIVESPLFIFDLLLKAVFLPKALRSFKKLGKPQGVIINEHMLKFHDQDKRVEIREKFFRHTKN